MDHKEDDFRKICFHCASIYEMEDGEILTCPFCGRSIPTSEYERVMQGIRQSVFGGWTCRAEYEGAAFRLKVRKADETLLYRILR